MRARPVEPVLRAWSAGLVENTSFQQMTEEFARIVIPKVWEHASELLDGAYAIPLAETADAVRVLAERTRVIAEGAGALPVAAALHHDLGRRVVCVVSGGNIDPAVFARILQGETP